MKIVIADLDEEFVNIARNNCRAGQICDDCDAPAEYDDGACLHCEECFLADVNRADTFSENDRAQRRAESGYAQ